MPKIKITSFDAEKDHEQPKAGYPTTFQLAGEYTFELVGTDGDADETNNAFGPDESLTREQMATILYRHHQLFGGVIDAGDVNLYAGGPDAYVDGDDHSAYSTEALEWTIAKGIMGVNTDYVNAKGLITRAEMAAMVTRFQPEGPPTNPESIWQDLFEDFVLPIA